MNTFLSKYIGIFIVFILPKEKGEQKRLSEDSHITNQDYFVSAMDFLSSKQAFSNHSTRETPVITNNQPRMLPSFASVEELGAICIFLMDTDFLLSKTTDAPLQ